ncbi:MAG: Asp-tRNA(Asn)/Glu-tRNA(Gln) amidotransferase GatCAB subunit B, partial [Thermoflexales bacterium]|nr:Asp-tRNA(Asn)/Glu-tRNA(Gln) amidotransferase GatCAB subunit B [Thermoflexales bacterium]
YATKIREILRYLGVNSGDMEKGVLRFEANVSVRLRGSDTLGTRTEIKNLNSFRSLTLATAYEIERQIAVIEAGGEVVQETLGWDVARGATFSQRGKEHAHDYRYFPEPDLPPLHIDRPWVDEVAAALPELPDAKHARFVADYGLTPQDARVLVDDRAVADYFESAVRACRGAPASVGKWLIGELFYLMNRDSVAIDAVRVRPEALAQLVGLVDAGVLNQNSAKTVLGEMFAAGGQPDAIVKAKGLAQISDNDRLAEVVAQVLADNAGQVATYLAGKEGVYQWLMGQVMRATRGRAAPDVVRGLLSAALDAAREEGTSDI